MPALLMMLALDVWAQDQTSLVVAPPGRAVDLRVGERRGFSAVFAAPNPEYAWTLDGTRIGGGPAFEFRPTAPHVGRHEVSVTAVSGSNAVRHTWQVTVEAVGPPSVVRAAPNTAVVRVPGGETLRFEFQVEPATLTDQVTVRWSVDGTEMGDGPFLAMRAPADGAQRVRAVASSEHGGAVMREWQLVATPAAAPAQVAATPPTVPAPTLPEPKAKPETPPSAPAPAVEQVAALEPRPETPSKPPAAATPLAPPREPEPLPPAREAKPKPEPRLEPKPPPEARTPPPPLETARARPPIEDLGTVSVPPAAAKPAPPAGVNEDDVRALMFRYEQAWRTRNVSELRRIGHVETDDQESALAKYFATTTDLEVAVHVLELRVDGGRGRVRFTRRDRFRDPAGREVSKESPPIEKTVVRTPEGVHFAPRS
jgi:hypothetical protein